jgi:hypothetical protein
MFPSGVPKNSQLTFRTLPSILPREIVNRILWYCIAAQEIVVADPTSDPGSLVTYACSTDNFAESLSPSLRTEYWRIRHLSWLSVSPGRIHAIIWQTNQLYQDPKVFRSPYDFYVSHHILARNSQSRFPALTVPTPANLPGNADSLIREPHPFIHTHGLEKVILDFDASQYFAIFNVQLPPFTYHDPPAAQVLQHCRDLTLAFREAYRYAHPWYNLLDGEWENARCRLHACEMGKIVDWILDAAWSYIRHIKRIRLEGDLQSLVREKWERVFVDRVYEAEERRQDVESAWEVYPPVCECEVGCWEIGLKKVW